MNLFLNTPTLVAIAQGYDAITDIPDGSIIVLNRGSLRIQKTNATTKNAMYAQVMIEIEAEQQKEREKKEAAEKKKKDQEKKQREQEKKLAEKKQLEKIADQDTQTTKSFDLFTFDNSMIEQVINRPDLAQSEKNEILEFVVAYNNSSNFEKQTLSDQLKAMLSQ